MAEISCPTCKRVPVDVHERVVRRLSEGKSVSYRHECTACKARRVDVRAWVKATEPVGRTRQLADGYRDREIGAKTNDERRHEWVRGWG